MSTKPLVIVLSLGVVTVLAPIQEAIELPAYYVLPDYHREAPKPAPAPTATQIVHTTSTISLTLADMVRLRIV
jgi:hypothetical protein